MLGNRKFIQLAAIVVALVTAPLTAGIEARKGAPGRVDLVTRTAAGATSISQSVDPVTVTDSVACSSGSGVVAANSFRAYTLSDFAATLDQPYFRVAEIRFGFQSLSATEGAALTVKLHTSTTNPPTLASLTEIASTTVNAPGGTSSLTAAFAASPVLRVATDILVVEIQVPETTTHWVAPGINGAGETGPSYIQSTPCGIPEITPLSAFGAGWHQVQTVFGTNISISPDSGIHTGGGTMTIAGVDFGAGATVTIGGENATVLTNTPTEMTVVIPELVPGTLNDVVITTASLVVTTIDEAYLADYLDVQQAHGFHDFIETITRAHITGGCGGGSFCPDDELTRQQIAVFLLVAKYGSGYAPPVFVGTGFTDVPADSPYKNWIEQLAAEGITGGCGGTEFCPLAPVSRQQMAVLLLVTKEGSGYTPPAATGIFTDVEISSPYAAWIEEIYNRGITGGCGATRFCPEEPTTRGEMAVFLSVAFGL